MRASLSIVVVPLLCLAGCAGSTQKPPPLSEGGVARESDGEEGPRVMPSPEELYAMCEARVEEPRVDGECTTDDDCATAGCAGEVCTTKSAATDVMTTCENKICFSILDTCGCVDGQCSWSILDAVPLEATPIRPPIDGKPAPPLGSSLPSGGPPEETEEE
jgi:eight-cysteine-cluster-containing protein